MDDLDAQLAELQRQLRQEVKKSQSDFDWPEAPELDLNSIPPIPEPLKEKPASKQVAKPVTQKENKPENKKVKFATNNQAEKEVDNLTEKLMASLTTGAPAAGSTFSLGKCHKCNCEISSYENACSAMGYHFCISCLCCIKCGKNLHGGEFIVMETDEPYCHDCYEKSLEVCCECNKVIKTRILRAAGKTYHPECFKCTNCKCGLDGVPFTQDSENRPFCIECYHELHSPKCYKCKKPIAPLPGQKEAMRIIAMEKSFCLACFVCSNTKCSMNLSESKAGGCYPVNENFYCKTCSISAINETVMAS